MLYKVLCRVSWAIWRLPSNYSKRLVETKIIYLRKHFNSCFRFYARRFIFLDLGLTSLPTWDILYTFILLVPNNLPSNPDFKGHSVQPFRESPIYSNVNSLLVSSCRDTPPS